MPYPTYYKLIHTSLSSATTTFNNLNAFSTTFKDLAVLVNARSTNSSTSANLQLTINSNTSNLNATSIAIGETGASLINQANASSLNIALLPAATSTSNYYSTSFLYFPNIADTTSFKGFLFESTSVNPSVTNYKNWIGRGFVSVSGALTRLDFITGTGFTTDSEITIYGIARS